MQQLLNNLKKELEHSIAHLKNEVSLLHSSRSNPALVEDIPVPAYGQTMPLKQVASLSTPDARTIIVQPWDAILLPEIQKAIQNSNLGMSSAVEEKLIRLVLPQLSEERRKEVLKLLGKKIEESRIVIRRARDHALKEVDETLRSKEISEDEKFRMKDAIQKIIDESNKNIGLIEDQKAEEIKGQ